MGLSCGPIGAPWLPHPLTKFLETEKPRRGGEGTKGAKEKESCLGRAWHQEKEEAQPTATWQVCPGAASH